MLAPLTIEAIRAMIANRLRTFLTMLGMVIGVGAVVLMLAVGEGTRITIRKQVETLGTNLFIVLAGFQQASGARTGSGSRHTLTEADGKALLELEGVALASPVVNNNLQLVAGGQNWNCMVMGVNEMYLPLRDWEVASGRPMDALDVSSAARLVWLGKSTAKELFGSMEPVGQGVRLGQVPFTVAGILATKGQSLDGRDQDDTAIVPLSASQRYLVGSRFRGSIRMIMVQADNPQIMTSLQEDMRRLLRERHHLIDASQDDDFFINNMSSLMETAENMAKSMTLLLGAIASVSLCVGGIGIMNIMLVSVTERTREIGIRLSIGARQRDILTQFMLEAVLVSLTGGLLGLGAGAIGAWLVSYFLQTSVFITPMSLILSFTVSAGIGLFFGFYPAYKAAGQDPIEALRFQ
ncbi:MAG: ABC transporter permease [Deltaproteobacteria bacterium]|jgi:putative ABC transport system permease protein|nr:ABC transporter permease [Deltaproteobacteria bacterium]